MDVKNFATVKISENTYKRLVDLKEKTGIPYTELIKKAVERFPDIKI